MFAVGIQRWLNDEKLTSFFKILSVNYDRQNKEFVSTVEAKNYPIFGTQWHPEKPAFEWFENNIINHSANSILANNYMSFIFVNEARKNDNEFADKEEEARMLIYNWNPKYTYPDSFVQTYYFTE